MRRILLFSVLFLVLTIVIVSAEETANIGPLSTMKLEGTYGQCVSKYAGEKNNCYNIVKAAFEECGINSPDAKQCLEGYKKNKNSCKLVFKEEKKSICSRIKHNIFEEAVNSFK